MASPVSVEMAYSKGDAPTIEETEEVSTSTACRSETRQDHIANRLPLGQAIRKYPRTVGYVLGLIVGILLVGKWCPMAVFALITYRTRRIRYRHRWHDSRSPKIPAGLRHLPQ